MVDIYKNIQDEQPKVTFIKAFICILPLGFILHFGFLLIFLIKNVLPLVYFNILSFFIYIYIFFWGVKKNFYISVIIVFFEILIHSILCCIFIGWTGGFYVYPLCILPITYFVSINLSNKYIYGHLSAVIILFNYQFWNIYCANKQAPYQAKFQNIDSILYNINTISACTVLIILLYSLLSEMKYVQDMLKKKNEILDNMANYDTLTELKNRRCMLKILEDEFLNYQNTNQGFFIAIGDIDNFKNFNDTYGHDCGDIVLKKVSSILKKNFENDIGEVSRWGGEEFLIILKIQDENEAKKILNDTIQEIRDFNILYNKTNLKVTITIGVSYLGNSNDTIDEILKQADKNLYYGKKNGKNCIIIN